MPRLRDQRVAPQLSDEAASHYILHSGEWLYIPRGCPHAAVTPASRAEVAKVADNATLGHRATGSVHLSLSVDRERPFDMAGALHIALRYFCLRRPSSVNADPPYKRAKCHRTGSPPGRRRLSKAERWLHAHIDLAASAPKSALLRQSAFFRRSAELGTDHEALIAAASCWVEFADTVDEIGDLISRFSTVNGPGSEEALAWLHLLCDGVDTQGESASADPLQSPSSLADHFAEVEECQQLRSSFLEWVHSTDPTRWPAIVETAERIGKQLRHGRLALAAVLAGLRVPRYRSD